ncbi:MAG: hypothetical protein Q8L93_02345 [Rhodocyclaceae bacterium]|nr:hypothetical protein [Rhodocyclaceae bacterium]MDP1957056.1 hypothetical protein [Rhodocyclaceae bacterium]
MRLASLALLLVNLLLFAWGQGYLGEADAGREPERLRQQIEPDKLRILAAVAAPATPADELTRKLPEILAPLGDARRADGAPP